MAYALFIYPLVSLLIAWFLLRLIAELLCGHAVPGFAAAWCW